MGIFPYGYPEMQMLRPAQELPGFGNIMDILR